MARHNPFEKWLTQEDHLHRQICWYMRSQYPKVPWIHPPNEGKRTKFEQYLMKQLGAMPGASDLIVFWPTEHFHGLAMEVKVTYKNGKKNYPTKYQKAFLQMLNDLDWCTAVVWTFEEAQELIDKYMHGVRVEPEYPY